MQRLLIIPSILINKDRPSLTIKGEEGTDEMYKRICGDPVTLIPLLRRENSKSVHIHIFNENKGIPYSPNFDIIKQYPKLTEVAISLFCNFATIKDCENAISYRYSRLFLQDLILSDPEGVKQLVAKYSVHKICAFADYEDGKINFPLLKKSLPLDEAMVYFKHCGISRIMFNENDRSHQSNISLALIIHYINRKFGVKITLLDKINDFTVLNQLSRISFFGIDSVAMTDAFYHNNFPCQKIWRISEAELERKLLEK